MLIALTLDHEIGVDIEHGHDHFDLLELAETVFSPSERQRLADAAPALHRTLFYRYWVAKEAYIKTMGEDCRFRSKLSRSPSMRPTRTAGSPS